MSILIMLAYLISLRMTYLSSLHVASSNFSHSNFSKITFLLLPNILVNPYILIIYDSIANTIEKKKAMIFT